jgi:hypothetical protein
MANLPRFGTSRTVLAVKCALRRNMFILILVSIGTGDGNGSKGQVSASKEGKFCGLGLGGFRGFGDNERYEQKRRQAKVDVVVLGGASGRAAAPCA